MRLEWSANPTLASGLLHGPVQEGGSSCQTSGTNNRDLNNLLGNANTSHDDLKLCILGFLSAKDLLNVCSASKKLYEAANTLHLSNGILPATRSNSHNSGKFLARDYHIPVRLKKGSNEEATKNVEGEEIDLILHLPLSPFVLNEHVRFARIACSLQCWGKWRESQNERCVNVMIIEDVSTSGCGLQERTNRSSMNVVATSESVRFMGGENQSRRIVTMDFHPKSDAKYVLICRLGGVRGLQGGRQDADFSLRRTKIESLVSGTGLVLLYREITLNKKINWNLVGKIMTDQFVQMSLKQEAFKYSSYCDEAGKSLLHLLCLEQNCPSPYFPSLMKLFVKIVGPGIIRDDDGRTPLHDASESGHVDALRHLIASGCKDAILAFDQAGLTPLHYASRNGHTEAMKLLIEAGGREAVLSAGGYVGRTSLHYATEQGHVEAMKLLIDYGGRNIVLASDRAGCIPLHEASGFVAETTRLLLHIGGYQQRFHVEAIRLLVEAGGKDAVLARDREGRTPLHYAAENGVVDAIMLMMEVGEDIALLAGGLRDNFKRTPYDVACQNGDVKAMDLLLVG